MVSTFWTVLRVILFQVFTPQCVNWAYVTETGRTDVNVKISSHVDTTHSPITSSMMAYLFLTNVKIRQKPQISRKATCCLFKNYAIN